MSPKERSKAVVGNIWPESPKWLLGNIHPAPIALNWGGGGCFNKNYISPN